MDANTKKTLKKKAMDLNAKAQKYERMSAESASLIAAALADNKHPGHESILEFAEDASADRWEAGALPFARLEAKKEQSVEVKKESPPVVVEETKKEPVPQDKKPELPINLATGKPFGEIPATRDIVRILLETPGYVKIWVDKTENWALVYNCFNGFPPDELPSCCVPLKVFTDNWANPPIMKLDAKGYKVWVFDGPLKEK